MTNVLWPVAGHNSQGLLGKPGQFPGRIGQRLGHKTRERGQGARDRHPVLECTWDGNCDGCTELSGTLGRPSQPESHEMTKDL